MNRRLAIYAIIILSVFTVTSAEEQKDKIDKNLIIGIWIAHPFDGAGTKPRIEFKNNKKARLLLQDDEEKDATWEWRDPATLLITYQDNGRIIEAVVTQINKDSMTIVSSRGRESKYVKIASWDAKDP